MALAPVFCLGRCVPSGGGPGWLGGWLGGWGLGGSVRRCCCLLLWSLWVVGGLVWVSLGALGSLGPVLFVGLLLGALGAWAWLSPRWCVPLGGVCVRVGVGVSFVCRVWSSGRLWSCRSLSSVCLSVRLRRLPVSGALLLARSHSVLLLRFVAFDLCALEVKGGGGCGVALRRGPVASPPSRTLRPFRLKGDLVSPSSSRGAGWRGSAAIARCHLDPSEYRENTS